jgi:hypothetical protein
MMQANGTEPQNLIGTWQYHLDYVRKSDNFKDNQKEQILKGLSKLREFFSDEWLKEEIKSGYYHHPLVSYMSNYAPWSQLKLVDFANRLDSISNVPRFEKLLESLKNPEQYGGAESESDSLYKLKTAGFNLELYPNIGVGKRKADIKATIENNSYFFEITTLQPSLKEIAVSHTFNSLTFPYTFMDHDEIIVQCKIYKALAEPRIKELKNKIEQAITQVRQNKEFVYIGEPGIIDYLIVHKKMEEISGPGFLVDDVRRLEAKFWDEVKQLPKDRPSIIVIYANLIYFSEDAGSFYSGLAYEIEDTVFAHDNLVMGIIIGNEAGFRDGGTTIENPSYLFVKTYLNDLMSESTLIVKNRYSRFAILPTNENIVAAYIRAPKP